MSPFISSLNPRVSASSSRLVPVAGNTRPKSRDAVITAMLAGQAIDRIGQCSRQPEAAERRQHEGAERHRPEGGQRIPRGRTCNRINRGEGEDSGGSRLEQQAGCVFFAGERSYFSRAAGRRVSEVGGRAPRQRARHDAAVDRDDDVGAGESLDGSRGIRTRRGWCASASAPMSRSTRRRADPDTRNAPSGIATTR